MQKNKSFIGSPSWNFIDLTGQKFGKLLVISKSNDVISKSGKNKYVTYNCKCDCGKEKIIKGVLLSSGKTTSCGCYNVSKSRKDYGESSFNRLLRSYKNNAKRMGREFLLTTEFFKEITKNNCFYCGIEPKNTSKGGRCYGEYIYNGIDRIDNSLGYIEGNVISCCSTCNHAKATLGQNEFLTWIERVYEHSIGNIVYS